ncbi:uncharacterized protein LOC114723394 [Neltuma alba]|uniref:uncharacterized protein LOC114723394 n=1 Tax=Neltuma alba TaxID=207710 RepID=UPI0010A3AC49|nr:uncharacterized protein LOC114723394 [Prosopis alba]
MSISLSGFIIPIRLRTSNSLALFLYAATWTVFLVLTVGVVSFSTEMAFVSAVTSSSSFSKSCKMDGSIRVPLDVPGAMLCFPAPLFHKSKLDVIVPPILSVVVVTASAFMVRALGLWDHHQSH